MSPGLASEGAARCSQGTERAYELAKKYGVKTAWGADILFDAGAASRQGAYLAKMAALVHAGRGAEDGDRRQRRAAGAVRASSIPIRAGSASCEEGALADLLLVDGDPLEDLELVADPERNFLVIMKDGVVHKNTLAANPSARDVARVVDSRRSAQTGGRDRGRNRGADVVRAVRARVTGRVQGVCYRAWARSEAEAIGVTGWVRNERDGSVTALIAGPKGKVSRWSTRSGKGRARPRSTTSRPRRSPTSASRPDRFTIQ